MTSAATIAERRGDAMTSAVRDLRNGDRMKRFQALAARARRRASEAKDPQVQRAFEFVADGWDWLSLTQDPGTV